MSGVQSFIDEFWGGEPQDFPFSREKEGGSGNKQTIDNNDISRISRISRGEIGHIQDHSQTGQTGAGASARAGARVEGGAFGPGNAGTAGNASEDNSFHFPLDNSKTGNPGNAPAGSYPTPTPTRSGSAVAILQQVDPFRCFICGVHETAEKPLLPVLSEIRGQHHWMHSACWPEHARRCAQARNAASSDRKQDAPDTNGAA